MSYYESIWYPDVAEMGCVLFEFCKLGWVPNSANEGRIIVPTWATCMKQKTMRYQGNPAVEQRKADAWVDGTCSARVVGTGSAPWKFSLRKLGIILEQ